MDDDGSGKITYREFRGMVREELKLSKQAVPETALQKVWKALDDDSSGFITPKEFGEPRTVHVSTLLPSSVTLIICGVQVHS